MIKRRFKILLISALLIGLVIPGYISIVSSSNGNIKINTQGTSIPGQQIGAGGNVNLYLGGVTWDGEDFYLFITQDASSSQLGSGLVYTPIFSVYDTASATPTNHTGDYGTWVIGNNWINGSIPSTTTPGNYYIKAADQIGAVAVTETYLTVKATAYNSVLNISPASGPGGIPITLSGSQWPSSALVQIEYQDPYYGSWNTLTAVTSTALGQINTTLTAPDLKRSIGSNYSPETYSSISFRARAGAGAYTSIANYMEYQRGLTQVGNAATYGLLGNGTNLVSSVRVKNGDSLVIAGKWFYSNSPITIRWDSTNVVDTVSSNQWLSANIIGSTVATANGSFNITVTIPDAAVGEHYIAVEDSQTRITVKISLSTGTLQIAPSAGPGGATVQFSGSGYPASSTIDLSYHDLQFGQYRYWTSTTSTASGDISFTTEIPDLMQISYAGECNLSNPLTFRTEVNGIAYAYADYTQNARGLQQVGTRSAFSLFGNSTDLSASVRPKPGDSLFISGKWFHPGIVYIKLDSVNVIGTVYGNEWASSQVLGSTTTSQTGSFQTSVIIPTAIGGKHSIAVEDQQTKLIVKIFIDGPASLPTPTPAPTNSPTASPTPTPVLPSPTIDLSCKSTSINGLKVTITGQLSLNGNPVSDAPILLSYSVTGGSSWESLTLVNTAIDGQFSAVWQPDVTGNYLVKATVQSTSTMSQASKIINLALAPDAENNVFTLTSNSTITQFKFDTDKKELSFTASGPSGTKGYVNVYIPKSILSDISELKAYVDGNQVTYHSESQTDTWLVTFTYSHSTHHITMTVGSPEPVTDAALIPSIVYIIIPIVVVAIIAVSVFAFKRKR